MTWRASHGLGISVEEVQQILTDTVGMELIPAGGAVAFGVG